MPVFVDVQFVLIAFRNYGLRNVALCTEIPAGRDTAEKFPFSILIMRYGYRRCLHHWCNIGGMADQALIKISGNAKAPNRMGNSWCLIGNSPHSAVGRLLLLH